MALIRSGTMMLIYSLKSLALFARGRRTICFAINIFNSMSEIDCNRLLLLTQTYDRKQVR